MRSKSIADLQGKTHHPSMSDAEFLEQFEDLTLPFQQWSHRAHLKVAYLYLQDLPFERALAKVRQGIKAYNAANEVPEGPASGYNETTTHALLQLVAAIMHAYGKLLPVASADEFCDVHPELATRNVLRFFYSPERWMHPDAKTKFVEPDLASLPRIK
jgi:hypothetical protein